MRRGDWVSRMRMMDGGGGGGGGLGCIQESTDGFRTHPVEGVATILARDCALARDELLADWPGHFADLVLHLAALLPRAGRPAIGEAAGDI